MKLKFTLLLTFQYILQIIMGSFAILGMQLICEQLKFNFSSYWFALPAFFFAYMMPINPQAVMQKFPFREMFKEKK